MAEKQKLEIDVVLNAEDSLQKLRDLKKIQREVTAGSADYAKIQKAIKDTGDSIEEAKYSATGFKDVLEETPGPVGNLFKGLRQVEIATKSWGAAWKATGIGLLVSLIGGLVAAFAKTEGSLKKLEPITIAFEKTLGGVVEAVQPLLDGFLELALKVMPYVTDAFKVAYSAVTAVFQSLGKIGEAIGKLIEGDFSGAWDSAKQSVTSFKDNFVAAENRFETGYKKMTKTQKENLKEQNDAAEKAFQEALKRMESQDKLDAAALEKLKEEALAKADTEQKKLDVEKQYTQKLYDLRQKDLDDKIALYKKEGKDYTDLQTEKINLDKENIKAVAGFAEQQKKIDEDALKAKKDFEKKAGDIRTQAIADDLAKNKLAREDKYKQDLADLEADKQFILLSETQKNELRKALYTTFQNDVNKLDTEAKLKQAAIEKGDYDARYNRLAAGAAADLELQRSILEQKKANDDAYYANALANENLTAEQIRELNDKKLADQILYTEKSNDLEKQRIAVKQQALSDIISIAGAESDVGRAALVAKQILAAKELVLEISKTITFSAQAAARSVVAVAEGTAQTAKIGFPQNIPMLIGYAAQAFGIIAAIKSAVSSAKASTAGIGAVGGGAVSAPSIAAPTYSAPKGIGAPVITAGGSSSSPSAQLAETLAMSSGKPVKAYVVSQDIQSQTALDRRTNTAATFGGG